LPRGAPRAVTIVGAMSELSDSWFSNPVWHALQGPHRHLALFEGDACRYPADVAPFAAIEAPSDRSLDRLRSLLAIGESVWIADYGREARGIAVLDGLECVQMALPRAVEIAAPGREVTPLTGTHAHEMVALTDLAFPGFFRPGTYRMGSYFGVRVNGELVAMGGERLLLPGHPEMSGICTHPDHRGKGLATDLIRHLAHHHRRAGLISWLHVGAANRGAIGLYTGLGFEQVRTLMLHRIVRTG
jgi:ribosomal protein S18 acetylase RimI-like enzyme